MVPLQAKKTLVKVLVLWPGGKKSEREKYVFRKGKSNF